MCVNKVSKFNFSQQPYLTHKSTNHFSVNSLKKNLQAGDTEVLPSDILEVDTVYKKVLHSEATIAADTLWRLLPPQNKRVGEIGVLNLKLKQIP